MAKIQISYEFDYFEEHTLASRLVRSMDARDLLEEIDNELRVTMKHGSDGWPQSAWALCDKLREMIGESGILCE